MDEPCAKKCKLNDADGQQMAVEKDLLSIGETGEGLKQQTEKEKQDMDYISAIPTECLAEIFSYLHLYRLVRIERVSRRFKKVARKEGWLHVQYIEIHRGYYTGAVESLLNRAIRLKEVYLTHSPPAYVIDLLPQNLERLSIAYFGDYDFTKQLEALEYVPRFGQTLKSLSIHSMLHSNSNVKQQVKDKFCARFTEVLRSLPTLERLQFNHSCPTFLPPGLRYLHTWIYAGPSLNVIRLAADSCPQLCGLELSDITLEGVAILEQFENRLTFLWIWHIKEKEAAVIVQLRRLYRSGTLSRLRSFKIGGPERLKELIQPMPIPAPSV